MELGHRIRINTTWILGGTLTGRVFDFAIGIILARLLVPEDFGLLVTIQVFTGALGFVAGGGMGEALVQAKSVETRDYSLVFTIQLAICLVIYLGLFLIAPLFAAWFDESRYASLLPVAALTFILRPFSNIPRSKLRREMRFKAISIIQLSTLVPGSAISILLAVYGYGVWSLVLGGLCGTVFGIILLIATSGWRPALNFNFAKARRLAGYGLKVSVNDIILYLRNATSNLLISNSLGPAMVGLFNKANSLRTLPTEVLGGSTYQTVFRALSAEQDNLDRSRYIYLRTVTLLTVYTLPFFVGLFWLGEAFILTLYGPNWADAAAPLQIMSLAGPFLCIGGPAGAVAAAQNRLGTEIRIQTEAWILLAVGAYLGLPYGINGVAWGILPSLAFLPLRVTWLAKQCLGIETADLFRAVLPALILNLGLVALFALLVPFAKSALAQTHQSLYLASMIAAGATVYFIAFLYAPIPALTTEAARWKKRIHLPSF